MIIPLFMLSFVREVAFVAENSVDCYYHIAMADFGPSLFMQKNFSYLTMSAWSEAFSDKEILFHLILSGLREYQQLLKISLESPFNFPSIFFIALMLTAFVYCANYFKIKNLLYFSLLLIFISPFFTNRILMLRPHVLSITFMLLVPPLIDSIKSIRSSGKLFVFAALVAWGYSNPHFILLPVIAFSMVKWKKNPKLSLLLPLIALLGIVFGYTLHPQCPNTFLNWKIQCIDVVCQALQTSRVVAIGSEFSRPSFWWLFSNLFPYIFVLISFFLLIYLYTKKSLSFFSNLTAIAFVAITFTFLTFLGIRAMEYAVPFILLLLGFILKEYKSKNIKLPYIGNSLIIAKYAKVLIILLSISFLVFQTEVIRKRAVIEPLDDFAEWSKKSNIPKDTVIANLIWSDFPFLIYSTPQYRYLTGMDPMFSYALYPEKMKKLENLRLGKIRLTPKELSEVVSAKYAFVRKPYGLGAKLVKRGYPVLYDGRDGWLFQLNK